MQKTAYALLRSLVGSGMCIRDSLWLSGRGALVPFDGDASGPDGYRAVALLLGDAGVEVRTATAAEVAADLPRQGIGRMVMGSARAITFCSPQPANELRAEDAANGEPDGGRPLLTRFL